MFKIVLLRHGESIWNKQNIFTGWTDIDLSKFGEEQAIATGKKLKQAGFIFDLGFCSYLKRTKRTLSLLLSKMDLDIPVIADWRLNERHYGDLQGVNKELAVKIFGKDQIKIWRRSYDVCPPIISSNNKYNQKNDLIYKNILVPETESLKDVTKRVSSFWDEKIIPPLKEDKKIVIVASGNSLRALIKYLDKINSDEITNLEIPTGQPIVYELDNFYKPIRHYKI